MTRRRLSPEQRKDELLDAASELVLESGVDGLGLEQVAERAGCSRNLAYTYFPNRAELVEALGARERQRFVGLMLERIPRPATFDEWLSAWVALILDIAEERGRLFAVLFDERSRDPERRRQAREPLALAVAVRMRESLGVGDDDAASLGHIVVGAVLGSAVAVAVRGVDRDLAERQLLLVLGALPVLVAED
ncbi:MAG TPA: TetR/AcrR family transcriptional regulator [Microthrixaceae bacterium]|nr:TetR/AcrR family transcriptional regulator [Microthrixaceae bacterium]